MLVCLPSRRGRKYARTKTNTRNCAPNPNPRTANGTLRTMKSRSVAVAVSAANRSLPDKVSSNRSVTQRTAPTKSGIAWYGSSHGLNGKGASRSTIQSASPAREGACTGRTLRHRHAYHNRAATQIDQSADKHEIKWNFEKFLVGRDGKLVMRFSSKVRPDDKELTSAVEKIL